MAIEEKHKRLNIFDGIFFIFSAIAMSGVFMGFRDKMTILCSLGWGMAFVWMLVARGYKGMTDAYKTNNKDFISILEKELAELEKKEQK
jgi:hypothetical protein